jgi:cell division protease FtsH
VAVLERHREQLDRVAAALLEKETLDEVEAYGAAGLPTRDARPRADFIADGYPTSSVKRT